MPGAAPAPWITVIGIGEDGLDGLSPRARALVARAELLVGGERHLAHVPAGTGERLGWDGGFEVACDRIARRQGRRIVVLASGDPLYYGAGSTLARRFGAAALNVIPAPGAVSLAAARLGWSIPEIDVATVHGRPIENLNFHLQPGRRIIALARDGNSPAEAARLLTEQGYGPSLLWVFEHLGGADERRLEGIAASWSHPPGADLNTLAIECRLAPGARALSRLAGLPDDAYRHDGQITKREVRAITLARLAPLSGEVLWDIGAGSGSVAIEWMRAGRGLRAIAIERDPERARRIRENAQAMGVTRLEVVEGSAPEVLTALAPAPDAVFVGGAVAKPGLLEAAWSALKPGGRLVANAVTAESVSRLEALATTLGGDITRIRIEHRIANADTPKRPITQWVAAKPAEGGA